MALKKSDLYSSLWASCDELRGGMDASQYKDYVLFMLFIKYITDKYGNSDAFAPPVIIPKGASFKDMIALKGIRQQLLRSGYLKGIIGLPANLFYGTGIPACIVFVDKQDAHARKGIFMIDASASFMK